MGKTKVLFLEDVGRHGRAGEVREVTNGYARNYLLPRSLAVQATKDQLQRVDKIRKAGEERRIRENQDTQALAERLEGTIVEFSMRASSSGRLFGSVTNIHIADKLSELLDIPIDRRTISMGEPIREPGKFEIDVRLPQQISATITVVVEGSGPGGQTAPGSGQIAAEEEVSFEEAVARVEGQAVSTEETMVPGTNPDAAGLEVERSPETLVGHDDLEPAGGVDNPPSVVSAEIDSEEDVKGEGESAEKG